MKILKGFVPSLNAKTSLGTNMIRSLAAQLGGEVNDDDVPDIIAPAPWMLAPGSGRDPG